MSGMRSVVEKGVLTDASVRYGSLHLWMIWQLLSLGAFILLLGIRIQRGAWQWDMDVIAYIGSLAVAHLLASSFVLWRLLRHGTVHAAHVLVGVAVAYSFWTLALFFLRFTTFTGRSHLLVAGVLSCILLLLPLLLPRWSYRALGLALVGGMGWFSLAQSEEPAGSDDEGAWDSLETTSLHIVRLLTHERAVRSAGTGGGLELLGPGVLAATGDGGFYYLSQGPSPDVLNSQRLPYEAPLNRDEFFKDTGVSGSDAQFRVADLLIQPLGDRVRLFVSHHYWHREERCHTVRVSVTEAPVESLLDGTARLGWTTLYETRPCLPMLTGDYPFVGIQVAGRMVQLDSMTILLAVGDMGFDGWNSPLNLPQDSLADYGKTIRIDVETGESRIYTYGHRNPQGLHVAPDGRIWSTEHGPQGGDELNLIVEGANYGWPFVTYGTDYGLMSWPLSEEPGRHTGYTAPVFAWTPSIGVSSVISVEKDLFSAWRGDLLVASLNWQMLFRVRIENDRAVLVEPLLRAPGRIRDIVEAPDGRIIMLYDDGGIGVLEPASAIGPRPYADDVQLEGARLFGGCQGCHSIGDGSDHGIGPDLRGVVGREVASAPGYRYSKALARLSGSWTPDRLDRFLADPRAFAPGTSMRVHPIYSAESRRMLIEYLASFAEED